MGIVGNRNITCDKTECMSVPKFIQGFPSKNYLFLLFVLEGSD